MKKNYSIPQIEVMQFSSEIIMDATINIINHSGGTSGNGNNGFTDENDIE